jgi:hypothetical protein
MGRKELVRDSSSRNGRVFLQISESEISKLKFQNGDFKSQISNLKSEIVLETVHCRSRVGCSGESKAAASTLNQFNKGEAVWFRLP